MAEAKASGGGGGDGEEYFSSKRAEVEADEEEFAQKAEEEDPFFALPGAGEDVSVLARAAIWFGKDSKKTRILEDYAQEHGHLFTGTESSHLTADGSGHSMECHDCHQKYLRLFEREIEQFIDEEGADLSAFEKDCEAVIAGKSLTLIDSESHKWFVDALMASLDYGQFHKLMCKAARKQGAVFAPRGGAAHK